MYLKGHILAALSEAFDRWVGLLISLDEETISKSSFDDGWSVKDKEP